MKEVKVEDRLAADCTPQEAVQFALEGMWRDATGGCPMRVSGEIYLCSKDSDGEKLLPCIYELTDGLKLDGCQTLKEMIREWKEFYHIELYEPDYYAERRRVVHDFTNES